MMLKMKQCDVFNPWGCLYHCSSSSNKAAFNSLFKTAYAYACKSALAECNLISSEEVISRDYNRVKLTVCFLLGIYIIVFRF